MPAARSGRFALCSPGPRVRAFAFRRESGKRGLATLPNPGRAVRISGAPLGRRQVPSARDRLHFTQQHSRCLQRLASACDLPTYLYPPVMKHPRIVPGFRPRRSSPQHGLVCCSQRRVQSVFEVVCQTHAHPVRTNLLEEMPNRPVRCHGITWASPGRGWGRGLILSGHSQGNACDPPHNRIAVITSVRC